MATLVMWKVASVKFQRESLMPRVAWKNTN